MEISSNQRRQRSGAMGATSKAYLIGCGIGSMAAAAFMIRDGQVPAGNPRRIAAQAIASRKHPKTNLHSISVSALKKLSKTVTEQDRIPRRASRPLGDRP